LTPNEKNAFTPAAQSILSALPFLARVSFMVRLHPTPPAKNQAASFLDTSKAELGVVFSMDRLHGVSTAHDLRPSFMQTKCTNAHTHAHARAHTHTCWSLLAHLQYDGRQRLQSSTLLCILDTPPSQFLQMQQPRWQTTILKMWRTQRRLGRTEKTRSQPKIDEKHTSK
jgi:hypothetical protein